MQEISLPLQMSEEENRAKLEASIRRHETYGDEFGNRQQRRQAARMARKQRRFQPKFGYASND